ncbi:MAG: alkyl sulfatase C-terminal domain-containing protein, partial [Alphaproteobacteria bacterium]
MGGSAAVLERTRKDFEDGNYRWVAQVLSHLVFAEPGNLPGRALLADAFEQLGYQAESASWRNSYLYGAQELRQGVERLGPRRVLGPGILAGVTTGTLFDFMAIRLNGPNAAGLHWRINWVLRDSGEHAAMNLQNCTLTHVFSDMPTEADVTVETDHATLVSLNIREMDVDRAAKAGQLKIDGDQSIVASLFDMLDDFTMMFDVVAPSLEN